MRGSRRHTSAELTYSTDGLRHCSIIQVEAGMLSACIRRVEKTCHTRVGVRPSKRYITRVFEVGQLRYRARQTLPRPQCRVMASICNTWQSRFDLGSVPGGHDSSSATDIVARRSALDQPQGFLHNQQISLDHLGPVLYVSELVQLLRRVVCKLLPTYALFS